jgi:CheY-like chemotaxis protein
MDERVRSLPEANAGGVFHILLVDDDPVGAQLFQLLMKNLQRRYELHFARDGVEALEFLHRQGPHAEARRPNLILLDINMPRLGGLETLAAIKSDPELRVIPVIMLSTSNSPDDVRQSYLAHANGYVQKPTNLERSEKLVQAVEAFWIEFTLLPDTEERVPRKRQSTDFKKQQSKESGPQYIGPNIATESVEARSRAVDQNDSPDEAVTSSRKPGCQVYNRLLDEFGTAVRELIKLHEQQFLSIVEGDMECHRFDILIHMANEKKQMAKYACLRHIEEHGCSNFNAVDDARA